MPNNIIKTLCFLAIAACVPIGTSTTAADVLRDPVPDTGDPDLDLHIHDPSRILSIGGQGIIAVTGKEQTPEYRCGLEIWSREASVAGPWRQTECLLEDKPEWITERFQSNDGAYWAPDFIDAERIVYSAASNFTDGGPSCLGLVERQSNGQWRDSGAPIACTVPRGFDDVEISVIDPAIFRDTDGQSYVVTGGGVIHIASADLRQPALGLPFDFPSDGWTPLARGPLLEADEHDWIEAAFMHEHDGAFYLFVNWGSCCRGAASTYEIRVGRADTPLGPFVDREGRAMLDGYATLVLESDGAMRGPGHPAIRSTPQGDILSFHYYDANRGGLSWIGEARLNWNDGWPTPVAWE